jgi:hypothetical protein
MLQKYIVLVNVNTPDDLLVFCPLFVAVGRGWLKK